MIISHHHRFIFIKTKKTASTSVEIALSKYCGPEDTLTPLAGERLRRQLGYQGSQNYLIPLSQDPPEHLFRAHMTATNIRARVPAELWNNYFKFAVERNPWDKVVSFYFFKFRDPGTRPPFGEFVESHLLNQVRTMDQYCVDGVIAMDRVLRFENLVEEMRSVAGLLGFPDTPELPNAKTGFRPSGQSYRDMYDDASREIVRARYEREIDYFGYTF